MLETCRNRKAASRHPYTGNRINRRLLTSWMTLHLFTASVKQESSTMHAANQHRACRKNCMNRKAAIRDFQVGNCMYRKEWASWMTLQFITAPDKQEISLMQAGNQHRACRKSAFCTLELAAWTGNCSDRKLLITWMKLHLITAPDEE